MPYAVDFNTVSTAGLESSPVAPDKANLRLLHAHCHRHYARSSKSPALLPASQPAGLA
jgi:hypothetical protein